MMRLALNSFVLSLLLLSVAANARASPAAAVVDGPVLESQPEGSSGWVVGVTPGIGALSLLERDPFGGLRGHVVSVHVGRMVRPRFALLWDTTGVFASGDGGSIDQVVTSVAGQYWFEERLWARVGIGAGGMSVRGEGNDEIARSGVRPALSLSLGLEVARLGTTSIDMRVSSSLVAYSWYKDIVALRSIGLGVTW